LDSERLAPGESWEEGFCDGLAKSRSMVVLYSRGAINDPNSDRSNFSRLEEQSPCDNLLLESRLAIELQKAGLLEKIYPVFIGNELPLSS
jgi:hypothetical protein